MAYTLVNPYITLLELVHELKLKSADVAAGSDLEDDLKEAIFHASRFIDEYTGRDFFYHNFLTTPLVLSENDGGIYDDQIFLPYSPIISVASIDVGGETWTPDIDYRVGQLSNDGRLFSLRGNWIVKGPDNLLTIYGSFGYFQTTSADVPAALPPKIKLATRIVAAAISGHNKKDIVDVTGNKLTIIESELPKIFFTLMGRRTPVFV